MWQIVAPSPSTRSTRHESSLLLAFANRRIQNIRVRNPGYRVWTRRDSFQERSLRDSGDTPSFGTCFHRGKRCWAKTRCSKAPYTCHRYGNESPLTFSRKLFLYGGIVFKCALLGLLCTPPVRYLRISRGRWSSAIRLRYRHQADDLSLQPAQLRGAYRGWTFDGRKFVPLAPPRPNRSPSVVPGGRHSRPSGYGNRLPLPFRRPAQPAF